VAYHEFCLILIESWGERFAKDIPVFLDPRRVLPFSPSGWEKALYPVSSGWREDFGSPWRHDSANEHAPDI
jgi:hypothetical protein